MKVMVSPTGARLGKEDHPSLPLSTPEIVAATVQSAAAGADALHLHVRDGQGQHSLDAGRYAEALSELGRALPGFPVQITTESGGVYPPQAQLQLLQDLLPPWASVSVREISHSPDTARQLYAFCAANGIAIQHILYDRSDMDLLRHWQAEGVLGEQEDVLLVLGRYATAQAGRPDMLGPLLAHLPAVARWMVCAFGPQEHECLIRAAELGGDLRVGFENSTHRADGVPWRSVAASVAALCQKTGHASCHTFSHAI